MIERRAMVKPSKPDLYADLATQLEALLQGERDFIANAANTAALLFHTLPDVNWAGFSLLEQRSWFSDLFRGKPACVRIRVGRGVCGTAVARRESIVVADVHQFSWTHRMRRRLALGLVVPLLAGDVLWGVLDLDSPEPARFDD